jgi:hypothetical protein
MNQQIVVPSLPLADGLVRQLRYEWAVDLGVKYFKYSRGDVSKKYLQQSEHVIQSCAHIVKN